MGLERQGRIPPDPQPPKWDGGLNESVLVELDAPGVPAAISLATPRGVEVEELGLRSLDVEIDVVEVRVEVVVSAY